MILRFDERLYSRRALEAAVSAYGDLAPMTVSQSGGWLEVEVQGERPRLDESCDGDFEGEFFNHALWEAGK